jgi:tetratricopeptide (TPR) repeat protein
MGQGSIVMCAMVMSITYEMVRGTAILVAAAGLVLWFGWLFLKKSRDPGALLFRWIFTGAVMSWLLWYNHGVQGAGRLVGIVVAWVSGIVLAVVWAPVITDAVGRKFGSLYDGGDQEVDPKPFYSIFQALRAKGKYQEALTEVRRQLAKFPADVEGMMLLAELQAEKLNDLQGAEVTVERFAGQPGHAPMNVAYAFNRLADWHLELMKDRDGARRALERIVELLPDTEMSLQAAQRIGRLADTGTLLASSDRRRVTVEKGVDDVGLLREQESLKQGEKDPGLIVAGYVKHLDQHPLDAHIRESLAVLYANHYQRLDLAADQLEQLIQQPRQPAKNVVKWLNLLTDLQIQHGAEPDKIRATLQRIIELDPAAAAAENAQRRLDIVNLEIKARQTKNAAVKMGTYEQDIGLKRRESRQD